MQWFQSAPLLLKSFSFSVSAAQALGGLMFPALSPHSRLPFSVRTDSIIQRVLEDGFCIFGGYSDKMSTPVVAIFCRLILCNQ